MHVLELILELKTHEHQGKRDATIDLTAISKMLDQISSQTGILVIIIYLIERLFQEKKRLRKQCHHQCHHQTQLLMNRFYVLIMW